MEAESRSSGVVRWFSDQKGYGFITPEDGSEDLFVHQSSIKSEGFRSLNEGDVVEYSISVGENNKTKAIDVTGANGAAIGGERGRGGGRRWSYGGGRVGGGNCYNCGGAGHLARECVDASTRGGGGTCYNCGEAGHFSRDCTSVVAQGTCYNCGGHGHFARECQEPLVGADADAAAAAARAAAARGRAAGGGGGRVSTSSCFNCGLLGHLARDCSSV